MGAALMAGALVGYTLELGSLAVPTPAAVAFMTVVAEAYILALTVSLAIMLLSIKTIVRNRLQAIEASGKAFLSPGWIVPYLLSLKRYRRWFATAVLLYGSFYAVITSILVYQPDVDFTAAYGVSIPSATLTPVGAAPLFTPVFTAYITNHIGLLVIPLTALLSVVISILVGVNVVISAFAFDCRARSPGRGWLGGIGAVVGLFTGCPTCAGLFFANVLGGTGAVSFATIVGYYQPVFVLLSLPVLIITPFLVSRSLAKVFREGCVLVGPGA